VGEGAGLQRCPHPSEDRGSPVPVLV
jgi:hypothetical protein